MVGSGDSNTFNYDIICKLCDDLQQNDRRQRKKALERLHQELFQNVNVENLSRVFKEKNVYLLKSLSDPAEVCRDLAVKIINDFVVNLDTNDYYLTYIFPTLETRLGGAIIVEESEEIRLSLVKCIHTIIDKYGNASLVSFYDALVTVLSKTVVDPYPKVKQESCQCISDLSKAIPREFHIQAETLLKPTMILLSHQHFRVRLAAVTCIGDIVEKGGGALPGDAVVALAQCSADHQPAVRLAVVRVAHLWLTKHVDRYSYFYKFLPLILLGLTDEVPVNVAETEKLWCEVGEQFKNENEKDLKDQMDYLSERKPEHYPSSIVQRPSLGCRTLVSRQTGRLITGICNELSDWKVEVRFLASRLLCSVTVHVEENITQNLQTLLPVMYRSCHDEESIIRERIEYTSELLGYFVRPAAWWGVIQPVLDSGGRVTGVLCVLASLIKGSRREELDQFLVEICKTLKEKDVCQSRENIPQLLNCCEQLTAVCACADVAYDLFYLLMCVISIGRDVEKRWSDVLERFTLNLGLSDANELYQSHVRDLMRQLVPTAGAWTNVTVDKCLFEAVLMRAGSTIDSNFDIVLKILKESLIPKEADAEMRLSLFIALSSYLLQLGDRLDEAPHEDLRSELVLLIKDVLLFNMTWQPGRTAEALRGAVVACVCAALSVKGLNIESIGKELTACLMSASDETVPRTRDHALRALAAVLELLKGKLHVEQINKVYPALLKRLDDGSNNVRTRAVIALGTLFEELPDQYNAHETHQAHADLIYSTLIIHLDDDDVEYQKHVLDTLTIVGKANKEMLLNKIENAKPMFRNKQGCEILLNHLTDLKVQ